jgi:hypothetical protein
MSEKTVIQHNARSPWIRAEIPSDKCSMRFIAKPTATSHEMTMWLKRKFPESYRFWRSWNNLNNEREVIVYKQE